MTTYRVRRLTQTGQGVVQMEGRGAFAAATAQAGAVYDVAANEFECTEEQVLDGLRRGLLQTTDLVQQDGAWCSLADSIVFGDEAAKHAGGESLRRNFVGAVLVLGSIAFIVLVIIVRILLRVH